MLFLFKDADSFSGRTLVIATNLSTATDALIKRSPYLTYDNFRDRFELELTLEIPGLNQKNKGE